MIQAEKSAEYQFAPAHALVFHSATKKDGPYSSSDKAVVLTSHPILGSAQGPVIGPGSVVGLPDQEQLLGILTTNLSRRFSLLPERVLAVSAARLLWWMPAARRPMLVRTDRKIQRLLVPWPALVILVNGSSLSIAALAENARPHGDTPLFHAPLANTYAHCGVCTGSAVLPRSAGVDDLEGWEAVITESAFTHVNHDGTLRIAGKDEIDSGEHFRFWQRLSKERSTLFPVEALAPLDTTLSEWMQEDDR